MTARAARAAAVPGASRDAAPIRVMVVDDSSIARSIIRNIVTRQDDMRVAAVATCGREAIDMAATTDVDVVLLDLEMPGMSGADALPDILKARPYARVIMVSSASPHTARTAVRAVTRGAVDFVPKPSSGDNALEDFKKHLTAKIRDCRPAPPVLRAAPSVALESASRERRATRTVPGFEAAFGAIFIGASTGGPPALTRLVSDLAGDLRVPIFIVQHMPAAFIGTLAEMLTRTSGLVCQEARDGTLAEPGQVYIAPGERHMEVRKRGGRLSVHLHDGEMENFSRPAVDPLFRSAAKVLGARAFAIVLTGMGRDGLKGSEAVREAGGTVLAQDEASSVVWGMPRAVAEAGHANEVLALDRLGPRTASLLERRRGTAS